LSSNEVKPFIEESEMLKAAKEGSYARPSSKIYKNIDSFAGPCPLQMTVSLNHPFKQKQVLDVKKSLTGVQQILNFIYVVPTLTYRDFRFQRPLTIKNGIVKNPNASISQFALEVTNMHVNEFYGMSNSKDNVK
jgi:hypothetical protein